MKTIHKPVLLSESIELLDINPNGVYVDATAGFGGHSEKILNVLKSGSLFMIDQDPDAIEFIREKFKGNSNAIIVKGNFLNIKDLIKPFGVEFVDGILLDLGVSSFQLDSYKRGFSYNKETSFLDMRMSKEGLSAKDVINTYSFKSLKKIIWEYSQEKFSGNIAKAIVKKRESTVIKTVGQLVEIIKSAIPIKFFKKRNAHPARKTFQALRIEVNNELDVLKKGLDAAFSALKPKGRLAVITFHSLEDRIVKEKITNWRKDCVCPADFPMCICEKTKECHLITKKPIVPSKDELKDNLRSRSAKLRVIVSV
ncbi:MAG: 16S rRNA (cytosine(1402)-N(4))-methyltransferase RsmH [Oscillospiraceae bacterium]|jgi:16S rRNA (cytosine1402-N4)-methyltransferase|nr:16S rRNA (cytosine(1402)-N(4))-methyltransferase RsmH [Oscillospiraceae bacterium]